MLYMKLVWKRMVEPPINKLLSMSAMSKFVHLSIPYCGLWKASIQMKSTKPVRPYCYSTFLVMQLTQITTEPKMNVSIVLIVN